MEAICCNATFICTESPTAAPSEYPSVAPSSYPTDVPSVIPSAMPSAVPSVAPSEVPSVAPSVAPSVVSQLGAISAMSVSSSGNSTIIALSVVVAFLSGLFIGSFLISVNSRKKKSKKATVEEQV